MNSHVLAIVLQFLKHLSFIFILNVILSFIIVIFLRKRLDNILKYQEIKTEDEEDIFFEELDKTLSIFKVLIILSSIFIFIFSLFKVFSWIEAALPSMINFFLYFVVLCVCSFTHLFVYRFGLKEQINQLKILVDMIEKSGTVDVDVDDLVFAIENNNVQLETFLNYFLSISIFYISIHPINNNELTVIPILIAQAVFVIKLSENYLIRIFSE